MSEGGGRERLRIVVAGMVAGVPRHGGATWAVLQYVLGLRRLGHDVWLVEEWAGPGGPDDADGFERSESAAYFDALRARFDLEQRAALLLAGSEHTLGLPYRELRGAVREADLLLNISGLLTDPGLRDEAPVRAYVDLDPAFAQLWHETGVDVRFAGHNRFVTVGQAIGTPSSTVPTCGLDWIPSVPPVVLERWPALAPPASGDFTTIGNWRGYGSIEHEGVHYGQKAHSLRRFMSLPKRTGASVVLALTIHPDEKPDLEALDENGWQVVDAVEVAGDPDAYQRFIQGSKAELGIAKSGYVESRCGWFSDRSACYLASGRPVLAQETGFSEFLPTGDGLLPFATMDELLAGIEEIDRRYPEHARAARALAEEELASDRVLARLLDRVLA
jgi:hypothetical protein